MSIDEAGEKRGELRGTNVIRAAVMVWKNRATEQRALET